MATSQAVCSFRSFFGCFLVLAAVGTAVAPAHAAGQVEVSFAPTDRFTDAGRRGRERDDNLLTLSLHLQRLGQRDLPAGQSLQIEVLDVDLAGRLQPLRNGDEIRIVNGRADWPRIKLRWHLRADGRELRSAEETVSDIGFQQRIGSVAANGDPLHYEKTMLDAWFKARFASAGGLS